jgi:hypothetical protein
MSVISAALAAGAISDFGAWATVPPQPASSNIATAPQEAQPINLPVAIISRPP